MSSALPRPTTAWRRSYAKTRTRFRDLLWGRIAIFCRSRERNGYRRQVISVYHEDDTGPSILRGQPASNLDATLATANSPRGAVYPPGSVIQLIPTEAMVKHDKGFSAATHDWEFFALDVSKDGTRIGKRGTVDVVNRFGGNCFSCHVPAAAQWDLVCETDHGCAPLPVTRAMIGALQRTDPRCGNNPISPEDAEAIKKLEQLLKAPG